MRRSSDNFSRGFDNIFHRTINTDRRRFRDFVTENHEIIYKEAEFLRKLVKPAGGNLNCAEQTFYDKAYRNLWRLRQQQKWTNNRQEGFNAKHAFIMAYENTPKSIFQNRPDSHTIASHVEPAWAKIRDFEQFKSIHQQVHQILEQEAHNLIKTAISRNPEEAFTQARNQAKTFRDRAINAKRDVTQSAFNDRNILYTNLDILRDQRWKDSYINNISSSTSKEVIGSIKNIYVFAKKTGIQNQYIDKIVGYIEKDPILYSFL